MNPFNIINFAVVGIGIFILILIPLFFFWGHLHSTIHPKILFYQIILHTGLSVAVINNCPAKSYGDIKWEFGNNEKCGAFFSSPALNANNIIIGSRDKKLYCLNRTDGKLLWSFLTKGKIDSSPLICDDKVIVTSADGRIYMMSLNSGKKSWQYEVGNEPTSPAVIGSMVLVGPKDRTVFTFK